MKKIIISGILTTLFLPQIASARVERDGWDNPGPTAQQIAAEKKRVAAEKKKKDAEAAAKAAREAQEIADSKARVQKEYDQISKSLDDKIAVLKNDWVEQIKELDREVLTADLVESIKAELEDYLDELILKKNAEKKTQEKKEAVEGDEEASLSHPPVQEALNIPFDSEVQKRLAALQSLFGHMQVVVAHSVPVSHPVNLQKEVEAKTRSEIHLMANKIVADIDLEKANFDLDIATTTDRWKQSPEVAKMVKELRVLLELKI